MPNFLKKIFPINITIGKLGGEAQTPFTSIFQARFSEFFGATANTQLLKNNKGWVFACVSAIAQDVANIELKLMRQTADGDEEVDDHSILTLLNRVNPRMTRHELFEITQSHQELEGNAFWLLAKTKTGEVCEIWPLRPDRVQFTQSKENPLLIETYTYRQKDGGKIDIPANEIIHFAGFNAEGDYPFPVRGVGTLQAAGLAVDTNFLSKEWNKNFFLNSARPDVILKTGGSLNKEEYERLKRQFDSAHRGADKAHKPIVLTGGLEIDKLTESARDMDFVSQLNTSRDEILGIFRVPKSVLGLTEGVNRATAEASLFAFAKGTIEPKMTKIVDTLNEFLIPLLDGPDSDLFFAFVSPVPADKDRILARFDRGHNRWLTTNDIRAIEGLPLTENGNDIFGPFTLAPIDTVISEEKKKEPARVKEKKEKPKNAKEAATLAASDYLNELFIKNKKSATIKKEEKKPEGPRVLSFEELQKYGFTWVKGILDRESRLAPLISQFFEEQKERVLDNIKEELKGLEQKEYSLKQAEDLIPPIEGEIIAVIDLISPEYREIIKEAGEDAVGLVGADFVFDAGREVVNEFIEKQTQILAAGINKTTFKELAPTLEEGIRAGESIEQITTRVNTVYDKIDRFRAAAIARTEVSTASNFGALEGYRQTGIRFKQWINFAPPDPERENCGPSPEVRRIDQLFSNGLDAPPVHPNCVCTTIPVFR